VLLGRNQMLPSSRRHKHSALPSSTDTRERSDERGHTAICTAVADRVAEAFREAVVDTWNMEFIERYACVHNGVLARQREQTGGSGRGPGVVQHPSDPFLFTKTSRIRVHCIAIITSCIGLQGARQFPVTFGTLGASTGINLSCLIIGSNSGG
jgi:hypothetical protein